MNGQVSDHRPDAAGAAVPEHTPLLSDSECIERLIFLAFIASPEPTMLANDGTVVLSWQQAIRCYAHQLRREWEAEQRTLALARGGTLNQAALDAAHAAVFGCPQPDAAPEPESEPDTHTHTHKGPSPTRVTAEA